MIRPAASERQTPFSLQKITLTELKSSRQHPQTPFLNRLYPKSIQKKHIVQSKPITTAQSPLISLLKNSNSHTNNGEKEQDDNDSIKRLTQINNLGMKKVMNPYAIADPRDQLRPSERNKMSQRFQLLDPNKNVVKIHVEESEDDDDINIEEVRGQSGSKINLFEKTKLRGISGDMIQLLSARNSPSALRLFDAQDMIESENGSNLQSFQSVQKKQSTTKLNKNQDDNQVETPNTRMSRKFYEKYNINPLETLQTIKNLKMTDMRLEIRSQVKKEMDAFQSFIRQFPSQKQNKKGCHSDRIEQFALPREFDTEDSIVNNSQELNKRKESSTSNKMNELKLMKGKKAIVKNNLEKKQDQLWQVFSIQPRASTSQNVRRNQNRSPRIKELTELERGTKVRNEKSRPRHQVSVLSMEQPIRRESQGVKLSRLQEKVIQNTHYKSSQQLQHNEEHNKSPEQRKLEEELRRNYFFKTRLYDRFKPKPSESQSIYISNPTQILDKISLNKNLLHNTQNFKTILKSKHQKTQSSPFLQSVMSQQRNIRSSVSNFRPTFGMEEEDPSRPKLSIQSPRSIIQPQPQEEEQKAIKIIRECLKAQKQAQIENVKMEYEREMIIKYYEDLGHLFQHLIQEEEFLESNKEKISDIFKDYLQQKQDFVVGKGKKDVLEDFIEQELEEYLEFRHHGATLYDAIIQKYTQQFNQQRKKKKKFLQLVI
ncbi:UNKNOWN [Stylonychia lemnae]|uniref:Uncharacterized protein n=1 Tax=Stylonychia lemnae TaxID=5949 RepID=A0A078ALD7_STYLE|nr:UNKNOWN [Stylonychia lemnae]|eukprot:CDW81673.1 UNKNOWN [Stylonychia lemnae]